MSRPMMLAIAVVIPSSASWAQSNPTLSEAERGIRRDAATAVHLRIDALDVRAHVDGRGADVSVEMLIGSDDANGHEANLALTLPADAVVTGYAVDVGGRMIPGQLLEAPKARNVYEDACNATSRAQARRRTWSFSTCRSRTGQIGTTKTTPSQCRPCVSAGNPR